MILIVTAASPQTIFIVSHSSLKEYLSFDAPAPPPDVRQGYALPSASQKNWGLCPRFGPEALKTLGAKPQQPKCITAGLSPALGGQAATVRAALKIM